MSVLGTCKVRSLNQLSSALFNLGRPCRSIRPSRSNRTAKSSTYIQTSHFTCAESNAYITYKLYKLYFTRKTCMVMLMTSQADSREKKISHICCNYWHGDWLHAFNVICNGWLNSKILSNKCYNFPPVNSKTRNKGNQVNKLTYGSPFVLSWAIRWGSCRDGWFRACMLMSPAIDQEAILPINNMSMASDINKREINSPKAP